MLAATALAPAAAPPAPHWAWLNRSLSVDSRVSLLLSAMTLEEKAAQLWQTNFMRGANASVGFPGVDGDPLGNESTRLAFMVQQKRLGIGSQYGVGHPECAVSASASKSACAKS
eukprot:SAG31_NODE_15624_length_746_cov_0.947450_1_plen_113_part_01